MIWRPSYHTRIAQLADFTTVIVSFFVSFVFWKIAFRYIHWKSVSPPIHYNFDWYIVLPFLALLFVWFLNYLGAYNIQRFTSLYKELKVLLKATILWLFIGTFILYMLTHVNIQRTYLIIEFFTVLGLLLLQKIVLLFIVKWGRRRGFNRLKVIVVGTGEQSEIFIETVYKKFHWGMDIIGVLEENGKTGFGKNHKVPVLGTYDEIELILKKYLPDEVIIAVSSLEVTNIAEILNVCLREGVQVRLCSDFFGNLSKHVHIDRLYGLNILSLGSSEKSELQIYIKRIIDIIGSLVALVLFSPFMIISAIGILISNGRPVFYSWKVVGLNKRPFNSWKFRTMIRDADKLKERLKDGNEMDGPVFKISNDPRIIPFGRWLRRYSIDETPQLLSVLKGDMSLVGPRPAGPHELDQYQSWHRRKLSIKPGITCLWQVSGRNKIKNFDEWVKLDLEYIDNWSIWLDLKIIFRTIVTVLKADGK